MEEINILDLNINLGGIIKGAADTKRSIDELTKSINALKEAEGDNTEEIIKQEAALKNLQRDYRTNTKLIQDLTKASAQNVTTVEEGRRALSAVSTLWAQQAKLYGENDEEVQKLAASKLALTERLKQLEGATGDTRRNVGNYTQSLKDALTQTGGLAGGALKLFDTLKANPFILIFDLVVKLGREIGKAQGIVDAFNQVLQPLFAIFQRFVGIAQDAVLPIFNSLSDGTKSFGDVLKDLGQAIIDNIVNRFTAFTVLGEGVALLFEGKLTEAVKKFGDGLIQFTSGVENGTDKFGKLIEEGSKASKIGTEIAKLEKEIGILNVAIETSEAKTRTRIESLRNLAKQEGVTAAEGIKALNEASKLEEKIEADRNKIVALRIKQAKLKASLNDTDIQAQLEIAKIQSEVDVNEAAKLTRQRELIEGTKTLRAAEAAQAKAASDAEKKRTQEELDLAAKTAEEKIKSFEIANKSRLKDDTILTTELVAEEVKRFTQLLKLQEDFFKAQEKAGKISKTELTGLLDGLEQQFEDFTTGLTAKGADQAITRLTDAVLDGRRRLLENGGGVLITPESVEQEIKLLTQLAADEAEVIKARLDAGTIRESEYLLAIAELRVKTDQAIAKSRAGLLTQEQAAEAINVKNRIDLLRLQGVSEQEIKREQLELQRQAEVAAAEKVGADVSAINKKYAAINAQLDKDAVRARIQLAANYLSAFSNLVGEQTEFGKLAASAAALINTFQAITEALKAPTLVQRIAGVAFATATGFKAVADINKVQTPDAPTPTIPRLAKGGIAGGNLHSQGGTKYYGEDGNVVELERDERWYVLNRRASAAINRLSNLNTAHGGRSFGQGPSSYLQDGGLARTVDRARDLDRPIVVDVKDIISETGRRVQVVDSATL